jgi:DNA-binding response OmpR family regulator
LDFQKVYESKEQLGVRKKVVNDSLSNRILIWKPVAEKRQLYLELEVPDLEIVEWFDTEKMDKIIDNLISNSLKYTPATGQVKVKLTTDENAWQISVFDTGIGIPKSERKNLFQRFYRAKNAINSQEAGSGLGLLLIHNYVTLHGGQISFTSEENIGTEFIIRFKHGAKHFKNSVMLDNSRLPILPEDVLSNEEQDYSKIKTKILIVEDNRDLRNYLKLSLSHNYKVYSVENGLEAWNKISVLNPDIIVSDVQMPEMSGLELCRKIKTTFETSHIPVILLTVMSDDKNLEEGLKTGADDFIPKPFDIKFLRIKIDNIINNRNILRKKFLDIEKVSESENAENKLNTEFIRKATQVFEDHILDSRFSITDFAQEMGLSRSVLYTKFQIITGYTPNDFIKVMRMKKAIQLFREKQYSINEVAHMTGFAEPGYFATCFRKIYGKTPKQFIEEEIR